MSDEDFEVWAEGFKERVRNHGQSQSGPILSDPYGHKYGPSPSHDGYGVCSCGAVENSDESVMTCTRSESC